jgi:chromosome segregation ATPase
MLDPKKVPEYMKYFAEFTALTKGELDAEYKRVQAKIDELEQKQNVLVVAKQNVEDAAKIAAEKAALEKAKSDHATMVATQTDKLTKYEADLKTAAEAHNANVAAHRKTVGEFEAMKQSHAAALTSREAQVSQRERDLENRMSALEQREKALDAKDQRVKNAMNTLNALSQAN